MFSFYSGLSKEEATSLFRFAFNLVTESSMNCSSPENVYPKYLIVYPCFNIWMDSTFSMESVIVYSSSLFKMMLTLFIRFIAKLISVKIIYMQSINLSVDPLSLDFFIADIMSVGEM